MKSYRVLFVLDDNYVYPFLMALGSFSIHAGRTRKVMLLNIREWLDGSSLISSESIGLIKRVCAALRLELEVVEIETPKNFFSWELHEYGHIPIAAWAKVIALFNLSLAGDEELLYLDPDILLLANFEEIFQLNTSASTSLLARQTSGHAYFEKFWSNQRAQSAPKNSSDTNWYFNSGILKLNLQTWQRYKFWISWEDLIQCPKKYKLEIVDQDLLNALVLGNYGALPVGFNCYPGEYNSFSSRIIHFAGGLKPWYFRNMLSRLHLVKPTRAAMALWRRNEKLTLEIVKENTDREIMLKLNKMRNQLNKNYRFVILQMFPKVSRSKIALWINNVRKTYLSEA
jgi:lipopolysaccharide biosynthesis glycosyltransferase